MLDEWIGFASGPLLRFALLVMGLGLARVLVLALLDLSAARRRAGDPSIAWPAVRRRLLLWTASAAPLRQRERIGYNLASILFHVGIVLVPLFFLGHVALWQRTLGLTLPALPGRVADALSVIMVAALAALLVARGAMRPVRQLSRAEDWALLVLALAVVVTGLAAAHPAWTPVPARAAYLVHLLAGELLLVVTPFTKLQHVVLFWTNPLSTELGWRFTPGAGERVRLRLGRADRGV